MKNNGRAINCLFSEYDDNLGVIKSGIVKIKIYYNTSVNEDILVIEDDQGNFK